MKKVSQYHPAAAEKTIPGPQPVSQSKHPKVCTVCHLQEMILKFEVHD